MSSFDDIWFTYKARIAAELRLKNNDLHSQVLLIWYAILLSAGSIVAIRYEKFLGPDTDILLAILSVALLAISMLVANKDFRGRALMMRANHIALKRLYDEFKLQTIAGEMKPELYSKLLAECENHTSYDDRYFRIFNKLGLTNRLPSKRDYAIFTLHWLIRLVGFAALYLLPLALVVWVKW